MRRLSTRMSVLLLAAIASVGLIIAGALAQPRCTLVSGDDTVSVPTSSLASGSVEFFCYRDSAGRKLRFILARASDGKVRSVMDACSQCYSFHKGFSASSKGLVRRLCGNRYALDKMDKGKASCVPIAAPSREENGRISIRIADLEKMSWLF
ncbi:MAG TPA: Fe-S-containing protein [Candidatus Binataceae bacterium]|nr:Fe-S-containing protein [Candidatus Binataceae bacterium]